MDQFHPLTIKLKIKMENEDFLYFLKFTLISRSNESTSAEKQRLVCLSDIIWNNFFATGFLVSSDLSSKEYSLEK